MTAAAVPLPCLARRRALPPPGFGGGLVVAVESLVVAPLDRLRASPASTFAFDTPLVTARTSFGAASVDRLREPPACAPAEAKANNEAITEANAVIKTS